MIVDRVAYLENYSKVIPYAKEIANALETGLAKDGRYEGDGDKFFYTVSTVNTRAKGTKGYETHAVYADVQVLLEGRERMDLGREIKETTSYDEEQDIQFFSGELASSWHAVPGWFVVFLPGEAHEPLIQEGKPETVRKVVFKVKMA
ncbi:MAG: YhcH/YjgK/YiaL family protein [Sphaerochaetaceae bacterium]|nr:YhcH/YjgK/YiaL family protein [Spirochaetales bacterium]MDY5499294.1 YhcH/YjgK/YiaL family protein [Sphaerochaetaceae bacterium]